MDDQPPPPGDEDAKTRLDVSQRSDDPDPGDEAAAGPGLRTDPEASRNQGTPTRHDRRKSDNVKGRRQSDNEDQGDDGKGKAQDDDKDKKGDDKGDEGKDGKKDGVDEDDPKVRRQKRIVIIVLVVLALITIIGGLLWWLHARHWENTDDAYVDTKITHLATRTAGAVVAVYVDDNRPVRAGQVVVQLDDATARTQLAQAQASRAQALAQLRQAHAEVGVAVAQLEQARTNTVGPAAQAARSARDYRRYAAVYASTPAAVAVQQLDASRATAIDAAAQLASAGKQVRTAKAQLGSNQTQIASALAQLQAADAQIAQANVTIGYARVTTPIDGTVTNRSVAVGNYAQLGQQLMDIVPARVWVTANYKETQLALMRVNQHVKIKVDACPDVAFTGHVDSIQRGAGQSFQVLPAQNATGNFVKVVQRVPVKIVFDHGDSRRCPLGPGMSVEPGVQVR